MKIGKEDGVYSVSFEARTIDDILALDDGREEEEEFAAVAQLSEWATKTYELTMRPFVQSMVTPEIAEAGRVMHPMRTQRYLFSGANPAMRSVKAMADRRRETRTPIAADNPFFQAEKLMADIVENNWNLFRDTRDAFIELAFHGIYGTPWMKRLAENGTHKHEVRDALQYPQVKEALAKSGAGGYAEAIIRMLILIARARGSVRRDRLERSNRILHSRPPFDTMTPEHRSRIIHEQTMIVEFAGKEAIATLPELPARRRRPREGGQSGDGNRRCGGRNGPADDRHVQAHPAGAEDHGEGLARTAARGRGPHPRHHAGCCVGAGRLIEIEKGLPGNEEPKK